MTTITTTHGTYSGRTIESIVRREYGRGAFVKYHADPNEPTVGYIVHQAPTDAYMIDATLIRVDE